MKINLMIGRRAFQNSLVLATTLITCTAVQANDQNDKVHAGKEHADKGGPMTAEKFVQKAMAGGQMEVQMGQLGQQHGQDAKVKALAAALVKDHSQANQKLQRIASSKNITAEKPGVEGKHQKHLDELQKQSGAEFDKKFVKMALKHHKKDIAEFEKAQTRLNDPELKRFVSETLPKLRQHQQMAQAAARSVGVDEATIAAEIEADDTAAGAAAGAESGLRQDDYDIDRPRSSLDGATDVEAGGTINQNNPSLDADARIGDRDFNASADVDTDDPAIETDLDTDTDNNIFEKGDGKILGLPTDKNDGKFLGVIPNPAADDNDDVDADVEADVDVDTEGESVGGAASVETETSKEK